MFYVVITVVGLLLGILLMLIWSKKKRSVRDIMNTIRERMGTEPVPDDDDTMPLKGIAVCDPPEPVG